jgi:hypothetical protein
MNDATPDFQDVDPAVAAYKRMLKECLDLRPSGTRQRLAAALGTHKSFVSQITNPTLRVPLPAQHVQTIFRICHFSQEEQSAFLQAYRLAHPSPSLPETAGENGARLLTIEVPAFGDIGRQDEVVDAINEFAARLIALARRKD